MFQHLLEISVLLVNKVRSSYHRVLYVVAEEYISVTNLQDLP